MESIGLRIINVLAKYYLRLKGLIAGSRGAVLVFHEIVGEEDISCKISPRTFKKIIEGLEKNNSFVSTRDILDKRGANRIAITFDDVPHSFLDNAYPLLKEKRIPFTLFIAKKFVGEIGFLSESEIVELDKDQLCTIGAHTCNHVKLRGEQDSNEDIVESKRYIESILHHDVEFFAYPYGRYDSVSRKNRNEVKQAGFEAGFSTIPSSIPNCFNRFFVPRKELIQ